MICPAPTPQRFGFLGFVLFFKQSLPACSHAGWVRAGGPVGARVIRVFAQDVARRGDAVDRAGDVCSRKPLAFDEGRRGRGWRVRATVATPHRITAALSSCPLDLSAVGGLLISPLFLI